jgi:hypothetical protein
LKLVIAGMFGSCLEMEFHGERGCKSVSEVLFQIHPTKNVFCCWVNLCCNCKIIEVPTSKIHVQPMLESLEGGGNS